MKTRELTFLALTAAFLAVLEGILGTYLHSLGFPFTGSLLVGVNLVFYLIAKRQAPFKGSIILLGLVFALLRLTLFPGFALMPAVAIFLEAVLLEGVFILLGTGVKGSVLGGILVSYFVIFFRLGSLYLMVHLGRMGVNPYPFGEWLEKLDSGMKLLMLLAPAVYGILMGLAALKVSRMMELRLPRRR